MSTDAGSFCRFLARPNGSTGSNFSIAMKAIDTSRSDYHEVFIKFSHVAAALAIYSGQMSFAEIIEKVGREHSYEAEVARMCGDKKMSRIVKPIEAGDFDDDSFKYTLPYIVFEWAQKGDTHNILSSDPRCSKRASWWLRALHHAAVGAKQLHNSDIAHQDIKPSNLVFFEVKNAKIADLGRAVRKYSSSHNDRKNGDPNHAPPELFYRLDDPNWDSKYLAQDLYMLGSLLFWYFAGKRSLTYVLLHETLDRKFFPTNFRGSYNDVLPGPGEVFWRNFGFFDRAFSPGNFI